MSKRHHSNRRKTYGRREHELHERRQREPVLPSNRPADEDLRTGGIADRLALFDRHASRPQYVLGD